MQYYKQIYLIIKAFASIFFHTLPPKLKKNNYAKNTAMPIIKITIQPYSIKIFIYKIKYSFKFNSLIENY